MAQLSEELHELAASKNFERRLFRPSKVALVYGSDTFQDPSFKRRLSDLFSRINVDSIPSTHFFSFVETSEYDVIVFLSNPEELKKLGDFPRKKDSIVLSFVPEFLSKESKKYRGISDAVVYCGDGNGSWEDVPNVAYRLLQSLLVPSMLNIDLADLKKIAQGTGAAFSIEGADQESVIAKLPPSSFTARAGLVHFSCSEDVKLKEVYYITKAIAARQIDSLEVSGDSQEEAKKYIRKINVKMGIRIRQESWEASGPRISLTAILFKL